MGKLKSNQISWFSTDAQVWIEMMRWENDHEDFKKDDEGRFVFDWEVSKLNSHGGYTVISSRYSNDPVRSGCGDKYPDAFEALQALSGFIDAWLEAEDYAERKRLDRREVENTSLFSHDLFDVFSDYHEELWMDCNVDVLIEGLEEDVKRMRERLEQHIVEAP